MALNIKDRETDRLARELAKTTGESLTVAIQRSLKERLEKEQSRKRQTALGREIMAISRRAAKLPRLTDRTPDEIIGYDKHGLPS